MYLIGAPHFPDPADWPLSLAKSAIIESRIPPCAGAPARRAPAAHDRTLIDPTALVHRTLDVTAQPGRQQMTEPVLRHPPD